ncbi:MAG: 3-hydroxyacyl-CoA dehydrogenase NAD-binding domain-containing protein [Chitinophagaceae bacterium]
MFKNQIKHVAVIGTGVIGISWATFYLKKGLRVNATDPAKDAEQRLRDGIFRHDPQLSQEGLRFEHRLEDAVRGVQFVQENGPERIDIKQALFRDLDRFTPPEVLLVSSSSGIVPTIFQAKAVHQGRILLGHPFNPPHLIPLVEVCGGEKTADNAISQIIEFYRSLGKKPVHLRKEIKGHIANRLQAALWQEAFSLVENGVASVEDIDTAIAEGPGLRWALLGPFLNLHLSGGDGGIKYFLEHLGTPLESWMRDLGKVLISPELIKLLTAGVNDLMANKSLPDLILKRDEMLTRLKELKHNNEEPG